MTIWLYQTSPQMNIQSSDYVFIELGLGEVV